MAYTFEVDPRALIRERTEQFAGLGIPRDVIAQVGVRIKSLWNDEPGSWPYEWSVAARRALGTNDPLLASLLYGIGKYPCLGNNVHRAVYQKQIKSYLLAAKQFPQRFERKFLNVPYGGGKTRVPVHLLSDKTVTREAPVVVRLGGVDTWKMDIHHSACYLSKKLGAHVAMVDMAGVGESEVPNSPDADVILSGVAEKLRALGNGRVGMLAFSFGGLWAVKLALTGRIDAAAAVGAPLSASFERDSLSRMPNGMPGIIGNSLFRDAPFASLDSLAEAMSPFSLRSEGLYDSRLSETPLLLANGSDDPCVPQSDVLDFSSRPNTITRLFENATHCASEKSAELMPWIVDWLAQQLHGGRTNLL